MFLCMQFQCLRLVKNVFIYLLYNHEISIQYMSFNTQSLTFLSAFEVIDSDLICKKRHPITKQVYSALCLYTRSQISS